MLQYTVYDTMMKDIQESRSEQVALGSHCIASGQVTAKDHMNCAGHSIQYRITFSTSGMCIAPVIPHCCM
jgi:hypothetical protein